MSWREVRGPLATGSTGSATTLGRTERHVPTLAGAATQGEPSPPPAGRGCGELGAARAQQRDERPTRVKRIGDRLGAVERGGRPQLAVDLGHEDGPGGQRARVQRGKPDKRG